MQAPHSGYSNSAKEGVAYPPMQRLAKRVIFAIRQKLARIPLSGLCLWRRQVVSGC